MASRGQKLDLQDCLLDTPKVHSQVDHFEAGLVPFREYVTLLRDTFQACHLHQEKVGEGARAVSNLLGNIDSELGEKAGSTSSSSAFSQLSRYQTELHSCQEMFNSQLQNSVVHRMSALLEEDMDHLLALKDTYDNSRQEHDHAMAKFSRTSKRRDSDKARFEANAELYVARKKFYQCTLDYISQLKEFQMRKRFMLLEPVLTFMHAQMGYFKACQEIMNSGFQQLLTNLNGDIQSYHSEHENEVRELQQQKTELELQFPTLCVPDPDLADPFTEFPTPNTGLSSKYGYLYLRIQKGGLAAKWERAFFFTKNGYLYTQSLQNNAEALLQLKEAHAFASDCDDRRYVMQISHPALKKPVFLQAESDTQRTEWISVIRNNSIRKSQHGESLGNQTHDGARLRTRLYDSLERERIRLWASKELNQEPGSSRAAPSLPPSSVRPSSLGGGLKGATPPQGRPKSPLRSLKTATSSQQTNPETNSRATKSPQRSFSLLGLGSGGKKPPSPRPPSLSSSKMAEVQNWVHSTNAATAMAQSLNHSPPSGELVVKFPVRYLGQKEVVEPKNPSTISGTIRGVITARAVKKVKPATSIELAIQLKKITLIETQSNKAIGKFLLKDIINCAVHPEDEKLFGVVCRVAEPERVKYVCHVIQADQSGSKVAGAISEAIQKLWRMVQGREGGGQRSGTDKKQIPPARPPPPVAPYSGSFLTSYTPAPPALSSSSHHHRTHTSPGALSSTLATPAFPTQHRSSSDSGMAPPPRPGSGSGPGEEVGVSGSWAMATISLLPPSLPDSSSTSAESLALGRHDEGDSQQPPFINEDSPLMFADILEENEDLPLISFDHSVLGGFGTPTPDPSPLPDGYVTDGGGEGADFGSSSTATMQVPTETTTTAFLSKGGGGSGYVSTPHPSSTSPSPTPPTVTSSQLSLPPRHPSSRPSHSPSPPAPTLPLTTTATVTSVQNHTASSSSRKNVKPVAAKSSSTAKPVKTTDSETGQAAPTTTTVSAADSLAQALGFETISSYTPPPPSTTTTGEGGNATAGGTKSADPLAEAFGFETTPEDIENLIQLMAPDSDLQLQGGVADNGYMTSNPLHTEAYDDFGNS